MADAINIGGIIADLQVNSSHLDRGLANARKALEATGREFKQLDVELDKGRILLMDYTARAMALTRVENELTAAMNAAYGATSKVHTGLDVVNAGAGKLSTTAGRAGMAMMQFGSVIDDIQYGFKGVVNNIGPLAFALSGGNMSVAAGAQIAAVAAFQLYDHWGQLQSILGNTTPLEQAALTTKGIADELKKLKAQVEGFPRDGIVVKYQVKLEQAEENAKAEAAAQGMEGFQTDQQRKDSARFRQAIGENGGIEKLSRDLGKEIFDKGHISQFLTPGETKDLEFFKQQANDESLNSFHREEQRSKAAGLEQKARMNAEDQARRKIGLAQNSEPDRRQLVETFNASPDVFGDLGGVISGDLETDQEILAREKRERQRGIKDAGKAKKEAARKQELMLKQQADIDADNLRQSEAGMKDIEDRKKEEQDFDEDAAGVFKQAVRETKGLAPGGEKLAQVGIMNDMLGGKGGVTSAFQQIKEMMKSQGANEGVAHEAATQMMKDAGDKTKEDVLNEMLNGTSDQEKEKATKSQQFNVMELAAKVQAGVGGQQDEPKKQTGLMKRMVESLANIEKAKAVGFS